MDLSPVVSHLLAQGPIGLLCIGLTYALRSVWKKYDDVQQARLAELQTTTKALVESTAAIREVMEYLITRRRG